MVIYSTNQGPIKWPKDDSHDPDSEVIYTLDYFLPVRADSKAYIQGIDVVVPITPNGCMYECVSGGISNDTLPVLSTNEGKSFDDGDVKWRTLPLLTQLSYGDVISSSVWTGDTDVVLTADTITDNIATSIKVTAVPAGVTSFTITNTVEILYLSGDTEKRQKSIIIPIKEL